MGILNSDGDEKSKRGGSSDSKHGSSGGETAHWVSGMDGDGELVEDDRGDEWHGSSKLKKSSHEAGNGPSSVWLGDTKSESSHVSGCSGNSGRVSVSESATSRGIG